MYLLAFTLILGFAANQCFTKPLQWTKVTSTGTNPSAVLLPGFGYYENSTAKYILTFGGWSSSGVSDQSYYGYLSGVHPNITVNWTQTTSSTKPPARWAGFSGVCQSEDIFVIVGGSKSEYVNYIDVWYLDLLTDIWVEVNMTGTRPLERYAGGGGFFLGTCNFFLTMGFGGSFRTSDAFTIDFTGVRSKANLEWKLVGQNHNSYDPLNPHSRCLNGGTLVSADTFVMYGGCLNSPGVQAGGPCPSWDGWMFSLSTGSWTELPRCLSPRMYNVITPMPNATHIAVMYGGDTQSEGIPTVINPYIPEDEVVILNLLSGEKWIRVKSEPDPINGYPGWRQAHGMATGDGKIFLWSGSSLGFGFYYDDLWYLTGDYNENERYACPMHFFTTEIAHGTMMFIAFGICFQVAVFIARYARVKEPLWFYLHISFNSVGIFFAVFGFILAFMNRSLPVFTHALIGIAAMGLVLWQPLNAIFRPHTSKDEKPTIQRRIWAWMHRITGLLALLLGILNICLGFFLILSPPWVWGVWYFLLLCYIIFIAVMETLYWVKLFRKYKEEKA